MTSPFWGMALVWYGQEWAREERNAAQKRACAEKPCACKEFTRQVPELSALENRHSGELFALIERQRRQELALKYQHDVAALDANGANFDPKALLQEAKRASDAEMQFSIQKRSEAHELLSQQDRAFRVACAALLATQPSLRPMP